MKHIIAALYVCACGYQQIVHIPVDERVDKSLVAHQCRLALK